MSELKDLIRAALSQEFVENEPNVSEANLAGVLCNHFNNHSEHPEIIPMKEDDCIMWSARKTDEALDRLTAAVMRVIDAHAIDMCQTVEAQHEETGRMWKGERRALPPRYQEINAGAEVQTSRISAWRRGEA